MHCIDTIPESLLKEKLISLAALYGDADRAIRDFTLNVDFRCSFGCGKCCHGFVPDILPLEAAYIAAFLISKNRDTAEAIHHGGLTPLDSLADSPTCPLYLAATPYHCSVYEARPLVCRLFGFSGLRDKYADVSFSLCKYMEGPSALNAERKFRILQNDPRFPVTPPIMSQFGEKLQSLDPNNPGLRQLLHEALPSAIGHIFFLASFGQTNELIRNTKTRGAAQ